MYARRLFNDTTGLVVSLALATGLRLAGIGWGLPHTYEEATPLRVAVTMWGWQSDGAVSLNPSFFNYPSLTFYIHFLVQGALFLLLKLRGAIASAVDWQVMYVTDPTAQYVASRLVGVAFGVMTVLVTFRTARMVAGRRAGLVAALFMATSAYHVIRSQMIEVDVPLTFFMLLAVYAMVRIVNQGRWRDYLLAGTAIGLAASSKYTGAVLTVPLVVAHLLVGRAREGKSWMKLVGAAFLAAAVFAVTSPYVFIDWAQFQAALSLERAHMQAGHFGSDEGASWTYYGRALALHLVGTLALALAVVGMARLFRERARDAAVIAAAMVVYLGVLFTWSMKAEAYALPLVPVAMVLAGAGAVAVSELAARRVRRRWAAAGMLGVIALVVVATNLARLAEDRKTKQHDVRTDAQAWIEAHLPAGSYIVSESYGPDLLTPELILQLKPSIRSAVMNRWRERPVFAETGVPMYQSRPERSAPFYTLDVYPEADYIITTGSIRDRYAKDPVRFAAQTSFYHELDTRCRVLKEFSDADGMRIDIYQTPGRTQPFGARHDAATPPVLARDPSQSTGSEAALYFSMGTNDEYFRHSAAAAQCYELALRYGTSSPQLTYLVAFGYARSMIALGRGDEAVQNLRRMHEALHNPQLKAAIAQLLAHLEPEDQSP